MQHRVCHLSLILSAVPTSTRLTAHSLAQHSSRTNTQQRCKRPRLTSAVGSLGDAAWSRVLAITSAYKLPGDMRAPPSRYIDSARNDSDRPTETTAARFIRDNKAHMRTERGGLFLELRLTGNIPSQIFFGHHICEFTVSVCDFLHFPECLLTTPKVLLRSIKG